MSVARRVKEKKAVQPKAAPPTPRQDPLQAEALSDSLQDPLGDEGGAVQMETREQSRHDRRADRDEKDNDRRSGRDEFWTQSTASDWAGRAILKHYLFGGGEEATWDDANWAGYMKASNILSGTCKLKLLNLGKKLAAKGAGEYAVNETFAAELENGEGIVGYQYLHGSNADVGGFQIKGTAKVTEGKDGEMEVEFDVMYVWNDVIDPNPKYGSDTAKSWFAEIITLGYAEAYDLHIQWSEKSKLTRRANGTVKLSDGWPAK